MNAKNFIHAWHENFLTGNNDFLDEILDESVVFHAPGVCKPGPGKERTKMYWRAAGRAGKGEKGKEGREGQEELDSVLEFETYIDDIFVNGVDVIKWNSEGKIIDFKVMVRPHRAVTMVQQKMMQALEAYK